MLSSVNKWTIHLKFYPQTQTKFECGPTDQVRARQDKEVCWSYINIHFLVPVCSWNFSPIQIQLKIEMTTISTSASGDLA